jgi:hypothetical protein
VQDEDVAGAVAVDVDGWLDRGGSEGAGCDVGGAAGVVGEAEPVHAYRMLVVFDAVGHAASPHWTAYCAACRLSSGSSVALGELGRAVATVVSVVAWASSCQTSAAKGNAVCCGVLRFVRGCRG